MLKFRLSFLYSLFLLFVLVNLLEAKSVTFKDNAEAKNIFKKENLVGTIVIYNKQNNKFIGFNSKRANTRYSPASTFKVANSLIGLSSKAVKSVDEVFFKYKGQKVLLESWKKDSSLRDAIKVSNFLAYQELARRIGFKNMQLNLNKMNYGNAKIGNKIDEFWVDNSLKISAAEQAVFLSKLAANELPYSKKNQEDVKSIILLDKGKGWKLYGKTGWYVPKGKLDTTGWFVGFVENSKGIYSFATNIDIKKKDQKDFPEKLLGKRIEVTKEVLAKLNIIN